MKEKREEFLDEEQREQAYQAAINLFNSIQCMAESSSKIKMYHAAKIRFENLEDYKDSKDYIQICEDLINQSGYETKSAMNDEIVSKKEENRNGMPGAIRMILAIAIILVIAIFATRPSGKYYRAKIYRKMGAYPSAIQLFEKLGKYKDSKTRVLEAEYSYGLYLEKSGSFTKAEKAFLASKDYKDSREKVVEMIKKQINSLGLGGVITINEDKWKVIDMNQDKALLMLNKANQNKPYHLTEDDNLTWEKSTLRAWLNTEYMNEMFDEVFQKSIITTMNNNSNNSIYNTSGGNPTEDLVFILSEDEANQYANNLPSIKNNIWLRTPGAKQNMVSFLSNEGIMEYGYIGTSNKVKVQPVLWFDIK